MLGKAAPFRAPPEESGALTRDTGTTTLMATSETNGETAAREASAESKKGRPGRSEGRARGRDSRQRSAERRKGDTGKRYTATERDEILKFIGEYNAEHMRGGVTAASKKFGVSIPTLTAWTRRPAGLGELLGGGAGGQAPVMSSKANEARLALLQRMTQIQGEILKLQGEFEKLKSRL